MRKIAYAALLMLFTLTIGCNQEDGIYSNEQLLNQGRIELKNGVLSFSNQNVNILHLKHFINKLKT